MADYKKKSEKELDLIPNGAVYGSTDFIKFKHTALGIGKLLISAVKRDKEGNVLDSTDYYLDVWHGKALGFAMMSGVLQREAAVALKEGNIYKELRKWQGGTSAEDAKRKDGKCEARTFTVLPSSKGVFCLRIERGPGHKKDQGNGKTLYVPDFHSGKGELSVLIPVDAANAYALGGALDVVCSEWIKDDLKRRQAEYNEAWKKSKSSENTPKTTASQPKTSSTASQPKTSSNPPKTTAKPAAVPPKATAKPAEPTSSGSPSTGMFTCLTDIMFSKGNSAYIKCRREDGTEGYMRFIGCEKELALRRAEITSAATTKKAIDFLYTEEVNDKNQYIWYFVS